MRRHLLWFVTLTCLTATVLAAVAGAQGNSQSNTISGFSNLPPEAQSVILPQLAKLTASDEVVGDGFGQLVAMDGDTVVVTKYGLVGQGAAYVFVKPPTGWADMTQTAKLTASDGGPDDEMGTAVAISGDTIVVLRGTGGEAVAYVFVKPPTGWEDMTEVAQLSTPPSKDGVGPPGLATNGTTVFVGAPWATYDLNKKEAGVVYVYVEPTGGWVNMSYTAELQASDAGPSSYFGGPMSLSGNVLAVARSYDNGGPIEVFVKPKSGWKGTLTQTASLTASNGDPLFSVSMHGSTIVAGARLATVESEATVGAAYVFVEPPAGWANMTETAKLTATHPQANQQMGTSVTISNGGGRVIAGAPFWSSYTGGLYMFLRPVSGWVNIKQRAVLTASDLTPGDYFGMSTVSNSSVVVTAAPHPYEPGMGAVYVFGQQ